MAAVGVNVTPTYQEFDNFYDAWDAGFALELWGVNVGRQGGRLFPKANWANETIRAATWAAVQAAATATDGTADNAVLPASGAYHAEADYMQPDWQHTSAAGYQDECHRVLLQVSS